MKVLMSIKPEFASKIFAGIKRCEYRKRVFKRTDVTEIIVYESSPVSKIVGKMVINSITTKSPEKLWEETKSISGINKEYFDSYFASTEKANAILISSCVRFKDPIELASIGMRRPPQSFCYLNEAKISLP